MLLNKSSRTESTAMQIVNFSSLEFNKQRQLPNYSQYGYKEYIAMRINHKMEHSKGLMAGVAFLSSPRP